MNIMGIDIGTTSISMVLLDSKTKELVARETVNHGSFLPGETPEDKIQDPERIWRFVKEKSDELIQAYGLPAGVGLTGQMHGMLYVDADGEAVSPLYTWQDGNGNKPLCRKVGKDCGKFPYNDLNSVQFLRKYVGAAASGYGLTTHYYLQNMGKIPKNAVKMTTVSDYIAMKFCGNKTPVIGADMAASWGCFDLEKGEFRLEALRQAGVDATYLPEVRRGHFIVGSTEQGVPVMGSIGDNQASFIGSVDSLYDTVLINVGTGSQVTFVSKQYVDCGGSLELRPFTTDGYILAGSPLCGGRAYAMLEQFYREVSGQRDKSCYDVMQEQAQEFILRYGVQSAWRVATTFSGTRDDPGEKGRITGISTENFHPGAMTVGVIVGILDELYQQYMKMCELTGKEAKRLVGSGNGLRQNPLMQKLAQEMFGLKLELSRYQEEAACGAALCCCSLFSDSFCQGN